MNDEYIYELFVDEYEDCIEMLAIGKEIDLEQQLLKEKD